MVLVTRAGRQEYMEVEGSPGQEGCLCSGVTQGSRDEGGPQGGRHLCNYRMVGNMVVVIMRANPKDASISATRDCWSKRSAELECPTNTKVVDRYEAHVVAHTLDCVTYCLVRYFDTLTAGCTLVFDSFKSFNSVFSSSSTFFCSSITLDSL